MKIPKAGLLIATSVPRSAAAHMGTFFAEYRVSHFTQARYNALRDLTTYPYARYCLEERRIDVLEDGTRQEQEWQLWTWKDTPRATIEDVIGDDRFCAAVSLHPLHAEVVKKARWTIDRAQRARDLEKAIQQLQAEIVETKRQANAKYAKACEKYEGQPEKIRQREAQLHTEYDSLLEQLRVRYNEALENHKAVLKERYKKDADPVTAAEGLPAEVAS